MAHELEMLDGQASFASFREPAWHGLGEVFTEEKSTTEMLQAARLDGWNVRLEDVPVPDDFNTDKNYFFVTRTNPVSGENDILGVVGEHEQSVFALRGRKSLHIHIGKAPCRHATGIKNVLNARLQ